MKGELNKGHTGGKLVDDEDIDVSEIPMKPIKSATSSIRSSNNSTRYHTSTTQITSKATSANAKLASAFVHGKIISGAQRAAKKVVAMDEDDLLDDDLCSTAAGSTTSSMSSKSSYTTTHGAKVDVHVKETVTRTETDCPDEDCMNDESYKNAMSQANRFKKELES
jgi:hypothetical protein